MNRSRISRLVGVLAAAALVPVLASCSTGPAVSEPGGGPLRIAVAGAPTDSLDITRASTSMSFAVDLNLFDSVAVQRDGEVQLQAVDSARPNADATEWTLTVRPGTSFHDGTSVTAQDVLYSLTYIGTSVQYASLYSDVDFAASTATDERTVKLKVKRPRADLIEAAFAQVSMVFPDGTTDFSAPVGSGAYELESFSPETGAVLTANEAYWDGAPSIEKVEILPIADAETRATALVDGQVDLAIALSATGTEKVKGAGFTVASGGLQNSSAYSFSLNTTMAPFDDPEVRAAFKTLVDRQKLIDVVFRGEGEVGADVVGAGLAGYDDTLRAPEGDREAATQVLAEHGVTELSILVAEMAPGLTDSVSLLAQQLEDAGITLAVTEGDPATLFSDLAPIRESQLFATFYVNRPVANTLPTFTAQDSPYNYSGWKDEAYTGLLAQSQATADPQRRAALLDEAQARLAELGGDLVWGYKPDAFGAAHGVAGVQLSQSVPLLAGASFE